MRRYFAPAWLLAVLVIIAVLAYFASRLQDLQFRDAAFANLFATILGILVGVPIAVEINRRQELAREQRDSAKKVADEQNRIRSLYYRLSDELSVNRQRLDRLQSALTESDTSRVAHWAWMITIADAFSFDAFRDFARSELKRALPWDLEDAVETAYSLLKGTGDRVREAAAAHTFYSGQGADATIANQTWGALLMGARKAAQLNFVTQLARETNRRVEEAIELFGRYRDLFPRPKAAS